MKKASPLLLIFGLIAVAVGVMMPIMSHNFDGQAFKWVYTAGAFLTLLARLFQPAPPQGAPLKLRRLMRMESWSAILFCVAAFFAFYSAPVFRDWLAFTLAGAAIQIYSSVALQIAMRKNKSQ